MSVEENKAIVRRFIEEATRGNLAIVDELVAPGFVFHNPADPDVGGGPEGMRRWLAGNSEAFPDFRFTIEDQIAEGTKVVTRLTGRGTHQGEAFGIPATGKPVTITAIFIDEVADGKLVGHWDEADILGVMQQLGAVPLPGAASGRT
jgi:steroid delta-isomerase-like uncharacterized protein